MMAIGSSYILQLSQSRGTPVTHPKMMFFSRPDSLRKSHWHQQQNQCQPYGLCWGQCIRRGLWTKSTKIANNFTVYWKKNIQSRLIVQMSSCAPSGTSTWLLAEQMARGDLKSQSENTLDALFIFQRHVDPVTHHRGRVICIILALSATYEPPGKPPFSLFKRAFS